MSTQKKVYEVNLGGRIRWIIADSKKSILNFFFGLNRKKIYRRKDVRPEHWMFEL